MNNLTQEQKEELALHGITTAQEALESPAWLVGGEIRSALHGHVLEFFDHQPTGYDVHLGPPGKNHYMGAHAEADEHGHLRWRACTETTLLRNAVGIEAHGGAVFSHPIPLNPRTIYLELKVSNGVEKTLMKIHQAAIYKREYSHDAFGNKIDRDGSSVTFTTPEGVWATLLLEGNAVAGIVTPLPDRDVTVTVGNETFVVSVPGDTEVTLASLLANKVSGTVNVEWDGKTETLTQRALWNEKVVGDIVTAW